MHALRHQHMIARCCRVLRTGVQEILEGNTDFSFDDDPLYGLGNAPLELAPTIVGLFSAF